MKNILIIPATLLALAGCDNRPIQEVNLFCGDAYRAEDTVINAKIYKDHVDLVINDNMKISLPRKIENATSFKARNDHMLFQEDDKPAHFAMLLDLEKQAAKYFSIEFEKSNHSYGCEVLVPFKIGKKVKKNKIEKCIDEISSKVHFAGENAENFKSLVISNIWPMKEIELSAAKAKQLSDNWDYANPKFYNNDDNILNDYEKDACETLDRVNSYINYKAAEFTARATDPEYACKKIATGKLGDYILKCNRRLSIWNKLRYGGKIDSKFVSAGKDSIEDYLKDTKEENTIYINVVDKEKCYRVLSPEAENSNGMYAIQYCENPKMPEK